MTPSWWKLRASRLALRTVGRRSASLAAGVAVWLAARGALADAPRPKLVEGDVTLDYRRGAGTAACPDEAALRERAADAFDFRDPFVPRGASASGHMRIEIERAARSYQGKVILVDDAGTALASSAEEHADCDALVWLLGHRVALAILRRSGVSAPDPAISKPISDPQLAVVRIPVPLHEPPVACDARCVEELAKGHAPRAEPPRETAFSLTAGGLVTAGWTADIGTGAWIGGAARAGIFSLGLEIRSTFPARTLTFDAVRSASVTTLSVAGIPCAHWKMLAGCLVVEAGAVLFLVPSPRKPIVPDALLSLGPRLALDLPIVAGFSVRAAAELAVHPYLPIFTVRATNEPDSLVKRWTTPLASGALGLGLVWAR